MYSMYDSSTHLVFLDLGCFFSFLNLRFILEVRLHHLKIVFLVVAENVGDLEGFVNVGQCEVSR